MPEARLQRTREAYADAHPLAMLRELTTQPITLHVAESMDILVTDADGNRQRIRVRKGEAFNPHAKVS